jgi:hypothetical protein
VSKLNPKWSRANGLILIFFAAAVVLGIGLILIEKNPGKSEAQVQTATQADSTETDSEQGSSTTMSVNTLPLDDLSVTAITEMSGLTFPTDMTEFLTSRGDTNRQLDLTFVIPSASAATFLADSGLPAPVANKRVVIHSSPLWKVNPQEGSTISSSQGRFGQVKRAVELVGESPGFIRARVVITPN